MEEQTITQPTKGNFIWAIVISIVATALIVGSGIYLWQKSKINIVNQQLQQQITLLQNQITELQKEPTTTAPTPASISNNIKFPVVVYARPGLLNNTTEGKAEKKNLEEKLINPFTDYYNETGTNLVALYITVPQNIGMAYEVAAIFGSEKQYGVEQFNFGKREQEYGYWKPECIEKQCVFSAAFRAKYPQIVE